MARKGNYVDWLTEDGLNIVRGWARDGYSDIQLSKNIGISQSTFYEWKNRFPEFSEAIKKGRAPVVVELEDALYKAGLGFEYKEVVEEITRTGEGDDAVEIKHRREVTRYSQPNVTALIFALKNLKKHKFKDRPVEEIERTDDLLMTLLRKWDDAAEQYSGEPETN